MNSIQVRILFLLQFIPGMGLDGSLREAQHTGQVRSHTIEMIMWDLMNISSKRGPSGIIGKISPTQKAIWEVILVLILLGREDKPLLPACIVASQDHPATSTQRDVSVLI